MTIDSSSRLRQVTAWSSLTDDDLAQLQARLRTRIVKARDMVCVQGDTDCCLFIVAAGRLQVIRTDAAGQARVVGEIPPGELFGEIALITGESRSASARAMRDTVLWELNEDDYYELLINHPALARNIIRIAVHRLRMANAGQSMAPRCQTIAVIPASDPILTARFVLELTSRLKSTQAVAVLDAATVQARSSPKRADSDTSAGEIELIDWLDEQERTNSLVIYVAEDGHLTWNQRCVRQADRVLLIADADSPAPDNRVQWQSLIEIESAELVVVRDSKPPSEEVPEHWTASRSWRASHSLQTAQDEDWRLLCQILVESIAAPEWLRSSPLFSSLSESDLRILTSGMEVISLYARDTLFQQDSPSDGLFIIINGRLQAAITSASGQETILGAMGRGEVIGEISLLTEEPRTATVRALRDSTVARLPLATLKRLADSRPAWSTSLARVVIDRLSGQRRLGSAGQSVCFAVQPLISNSYVGDFVRQLGASLADLGRCCTIDAAVVNRRFGFGAAQLERGDPGEAMIVDWFHRQELSSDFLILVCDDGKSAWTQRCLRQADQILLVALADAEPEPTPLETSLSDPADPIAQTPRQLVLLHLAAATSGTGTLRWLQPRKLKLHHHVRVENRDDMNRLARLLTQRSFGLALSGGGSRGVAHIGVVRAMREAGIPIDAVYGTSAGAAFAALVAMNASIPAMIEKSTNMLTRSLGHVLSMGPPLVSVMSGRHTNRLLRYWFEDALIEDQFIPCGIVSADLVTGDEYVHRQGLIREAVRASSSLPGAWPPVIDGERVLVDGGVVNNLPIDLVRQHCLNGKVIAVDIGGSDDYSHMEPFGTELSGWKVLARSLLPSRERTDLPAMMATISRCCTLTSANRIKSLKSSNQLLMLQPPITQYGIFEIRTESVIREVESKCHEYTRDALRVWKEACT